MKSNIELLVSELRLPGGLSREAKKLADSVRAELVAEYNATPAGSLRRGHIGRALRYIVRSCFDVDSHIQVDQGAAADALERLLPKLDSHEAPKAESIDDLFERLRPELIQLKTRRDCGDASEARKDRTANKTQGFYSADCGWVAFKKSGKAHNAPNDWYEVPEHLQATVESFFSRKTKGKR
ncbi:MAG: hypothetical protein MUC43_00080 [Pirellula sp.]|jgi:hypothetical protein|nr:hypothetical protein [Pirellula sp.]